MARNILYYFSWQEDVWLDEFLDRFREVNALVPNSKSLQLIQEEREQNPSVGMVIVVNVEEANAETEQFLQSLEKSPLYGEVPLFFVGLKNEQEEAGWLARYPQAKGIVVAEHTYDYDYEPILSRIEAEWEK